MKTEAQRDFIIKVIYFTIVLFMVYIGFKYFFGVLFPFVLGFLIAFALMPVINMIKNRFNIKDSFVSIIVLLVFYSVIGTGLFFGILKVVSLLKEVFESIPKMFNQDIQPLINQFTNWSNDLFYKINPDIIEFIQQFDKNIFDQLGGIVRNFSTGAINLLTGLVSKLPSFLIAFFMTIISSFFIAMDYKNIRSFLSNQITDENRNLMSAIKNNVVDVLANFFKAYGFLLGFTFLQSSLGLSLMKIDNAIGISLIIAMVDILPVLGTGTILVPWAFIEFFNGNIPDAIGLAVLYTSITVLRQVIEPRVVGDRIGLHPFVTLISMYLGVYIFGAVGLLGLPIIVTVVVKLNEDGIINIYRNPKKKVENKVESNA